LYVIKMDDDKTLVTTVPATIYCGESGADALMFLIPVSYGENSMADFTLLIHYILPDGTGCSEELLLDAIPYSTKYYKYHLVVDSHLTSKAGDIELWLTAVNAQDSVILKTSSTIVTIEKSKNVEDYLPSEDRSQLAQLVIQVDELQRNKADGLAYDDTSRELRLTSNGELIGNHVIVPSDKFLDESREAVEDTWSDMDDETDASDGSDNWEPM